MPEVFQSLLDNSEFWSGIIGAIVGAIVGGVIAFFVQLRALRETRDYRREDHHQVQMGLANSLLFKMIRIHSNIYQIHRHVESRFEKAESENLDWEPWQFTLPLATFPDAVHFSSEEMGLVLSLKDDELFNVLVDMDVVHNSLVEAARVMSAERRALGELMPRSRAHGDDLSGQLTTQQYLHLKPRMIEVNGIIESIRSGSSNDARQSLLALQALHKNLRDKVGISYDIESKVK